MKILSSLLCSLLVSFGPLPAFADRIVVIGDSLTCGPFGQALFDDLQSQGHSVILYCAVSSTAANWLNGTTPRGQRCQIRRGLANPAEDCPPNGKIPPLNSILADPRPDRVVLALGTNSLWSANAPRDHRTLAEAVAARASKGCDWIGPPQMGRQDLQNNLNGFYDSLENRIDGHCQLIDSRPATAPGSPGHQTTDGVHRTSTAGRAWYQAIQPQVRRATTNVSPPRSRANR